MRLVKLQFRKIPSIVVQELLVAENDESYITQELDGLHVFPKKNWAIEVT